MGGNRRMGFQRYFEGEKDSRRGGFFGLVFLGERSLEKEEKKRKRRRRERPLRLDHFCTLGSPFFNSFCYIFSHISLFPDI